MAAPTAYVRTLEVSPYSQLIREPYRSFKWTWNSCSWQLELLPPPARGGDGADLQQRPAHATVVLRFFPKRARTCTASLRLRLRNQRGGAHLDSAVSLHRFSACDDGDAAAARDQDGGGASEGGESSAAWGAFLPAIQMPRAPSAATHGQQAAAMPAAQGEPAAAEELSPWLLNDTLVLELLMEDASWWQPSQGQPAPLAAPERAGSGGSCTTSSAAAAEGGEGGAAGGGDGASQDGPAAEMEEEGAGGMVVVPSPFRAGLGGCARFLRRGCFTDTLLLCKGGGAAGVVLGAGAQLAVHRALLDLACGGDWEEALAAAASSNHGSAGDGAAPSGPAPTHGGSGGAAGQAVAASLCSTDAGTAGGSGDEDQEADSEAEAAEGEAQEFPFYAPPEVAAVVVELLYEERAQLPAVLLPTLLAVAQRHRLRWLELVVAQLLGLPLPEDWEAELARAGSGSATGLRRGTSLGASSGRARGSGGRRRRRSSAFSVNSPHCHTQPAGLAAAREGEGLEEGVGVREAAHAWADASALAAAGIDRADEILHALEGMRPPELSTARTQAAGKALRRHDSAGSVGGSTAAAVAVATASPRGLFYKRQLLWSPSCVADSVAGTSTDATTGGAALWHLAGAPAGGSRWSATRMGVCCAAAARTDQLLQTVLSSSLFAPVSGPGAALGRGMHSACIWRPRARTAGGGAPRAREGWLLWAHLA